MTTSTASLEALEATARRIRRHIVQMTHAAQSGHPGGSLSSVELLTALYFGGVLRYDPSRPDWPERDRFVMSKGHATPVLYAMLAEAGFFDVDVLMSFRQLDSCLQGHVVRGRPAGVEMSGGALGMGLSFSAAVLLFVAAEWLWAGVSTAAFVPFLVMMYVVDRMIPDPRAPR